VERWCAVAFACAQEVAVADFRACDGFDARPRLADLKMPALVIGAADDLLTPPKLTLEAAAGLANARAVVLPRAGHMLFHEQPDAFHQALDGFLREVP
jgi:pimeloyl-ACP methyl ester carboxylesterase